MTHPIHTKLMEKYASLIQTCVENAVIDNTRRIAFDDFCKTFSTWQFHDKLGIFKVYSFLMEIWKEYGTDGFVLFWEIRDTTKEERQKEKEEWIRNDMDLLPQMRKSILRIEDIKGRFMEFDVSCIAMNIDHYIRRYDQTLDSNYQPSLAHILSDADKYGPGLLIFTTDPNGNNIKLPDNA